MSRAPRERAAVTNSLWANVKVLARVIRIRRRHGEDGENGDDAREVDLLLARWREERHQCQGEDHVGKASMMSMHAMTTFS